MSGPGSPAALAIVGPTASGKTAISIEVARRLDGEVISMDSRQVYRGMDIGTAKATPEQRTVVPHHGLDLVDPDERFSAGMFARRARRWIQEIRGRRRVPILVGGTGFFLRALTNPIFREPDLDPERRAALRRFLEQQPTEELERWLSRLDPELGERFRAGTGGGGRQRILRGLEMALLTGFPLSWWQRHGEPEAPPVPVQVFVLNPPRERLFAAIDARVDEMLRRGLLEEVRALAERGYHGRHPGMNATGYIELLPVLRGERDLESAADLVRRNTRAYAKRQLTWLRHQLPPGAVWLDPLEPGSDPVQRIVEGWLASQEHAGKEHDRYGNPNQARSRETQEGRDPV